MEDFYTVHQDVDGKFYAKCNARRLGVGDSKPVDTSFDTEQEALNFIAEYQKARQLYAKKDK